MLYQTFKEELKLTLYNPFQKLEEGISKSFYKVNSITLIPKPYKYSTKKENHRSVPLLNLCAKNSQQSFSKSYPTMHKN